MISGKTSDYVSVFWELLMNTYETTEYILLKFMDSNAQLEERSFMHPMHRNQECLLLKTTLVLKSLI